MKNYPKDALHIYLENDPAVKKDDAVLNGLPGELYTIEDDVKIPDYCKCPFVTYQAGQN